MFVRRLWLRDRSRNLQLCSKADFPLSFQESSAASIRRESSSAGSFAGRNVGLELQEGFHGFLLGTSVSRFVDSRPGSSRYASTRRWMCTTNAWMLNSNANCIESRFLQQGDEMPGIEGVSEISRECTMVVVQDNANIGKPSLSYQKDGGGHVERKTSNRIGSQRARKSAGTASKRGLGMRDTSLIQGGDWSESKTIESLDDNDAKIGEESAQYGQTMDRKVLDKRAVYELAKLLEDKGWTESTGEFFLKKHTQRELSFLVVSRVIIQLKDVMLATSLFQWVCEHMGRDVSVYHAYLKALAMAKRFDEMWNLLTEMKSNGIEVSFIAFCIIIRECRVTGVPAMAVEVFKRAPEYGVELNINLHQALLTALFLSNLVRDARLLYSRMVQQGLNFDIHTFNTLIYGFGLTSDIEDAKKSFDILLKAGIRPSLSSYGALVSAYCNVHAIDNAMLVFFELRESGLTANANTMNIIIEALCKKGKFDDAIKLIGSVRTWCPPDMSTFIIVFNAMLSCKQISKAIGFFQIMEEEGLTNQWTYINLSNGLRQCSQTKEIQDLLKGLFAKYGYGNAEVCHALLYNLTSLGQVDEAEGLFKGIIDAELKPSLSAYIIMISFYCALKMPDRALQLFSDYKDRGFKPKVFCYTPIIGALLNVSRIADARKCFQEMLDQGYESNAVICNHLLREVCKLDMLGDIPEILSSMLRNKFVMRSSTFFQLAKCMCKAGKIKETNILCRSLHEFQCLELSREAAQQVIGVMKVMPMAA